MTLLILRSCSAASAARRTYVVNVSAMEGLFSRGYKGAGHPHTNMAKAALNMLTRTSAEEMLAKDGADGRPRAIPPANASTAAGRERSSRDRARGRSGGRAPRQRRAACRAART